MKEIKKLPLAFPVETLILSRRNKLGQLMCVPRRGWQTLIQDDPLRGEAGSRLSEMIPFRKEDVTCKVSDPPLPIFIKEDPAFWWQPVLCQFWLRKVQLPGGTICPGGIICSCVKAYGLVLVALSVLVAPSAIMWRITALCRRKAFRVQLVWLESRKDHLYAFWANDFVVWNTTLM